MNVLGAEMQRGQLYAFPKDAWHGVIAIRVVERFESAGLRGWTADFKRKGAEHWNTDPRARPIFWDNCRYDLTRVE